MGCSGCHDMQGSDDTDEFAERLKRGEGITRIALPFSSVSVPSGESATPIWKLGESY